MKDGSGRCQVFFVSAGQGARGTTGDGAYVSGAVSTGATGEAAAAYVVVYRAEHLLGRYQEARHLPDGHLEIHLRELEQPGASAERCARVPACRTA